MLRRALKGNAKAQVFLEYTIIIGVIVTVLIAMNTMIKRGIQGMVKSVSDQIGAQANAEQKFDEGGHLEAQYSTSRTTADQTTTELMGITNYIYDDIAAYASNTVTNLGFMEGD
ncbi:MAG: hypothetical protein JW847_05585 [Candidatus Omnitrophica bacterium]|nr:hypothetical protein [Candidatus Omnitrophota bacterium]